MRADQVPISTFVLKRVEAAGVDVRAAVARAGLAEHRLREPTVKLTTREYLALWRAIDAVAEPGLGLRLGSEAAVHQLDVASMAATHAPTFGAALEKLGRYKRLVCPEEVRVEIAEGEARVRFDWLFAEGPLPRTMVDGSFANVRSLLRRGTGVMLDPRRVELVRDEDGLVARHFACEVAFGCEADVIVFAAADLERPFVTHNPDLLAVMLPGLETALGAVEAGLVEDVKAALRKQMSGDRPTVESVAKAIHVSTRTLQRRLEEEGTTFQRLLDEVRRGVARELLRSTALDPGDVAYLLGFEELNSFTRAFRKWEGATPLQWRRASVRA